mgnify:CR=1 FL=1
MDKSFIKTQLLEFCNEFRKHAGTFYSYQIVHNYISFISSDKSIAIFLLPVVNSLEQEASSWKDDDIKKLENIIITEDNLDGLSDIPYFNDVFRLWKNDLTEKGVFKPVKALPIYFSFLSVMAHKIEEINEYQKNNQIEEAEKLIEEIKEESFSFLLNPVDKKQTLSYSKFATISMEMVNKYIIDEIDSIAILENNTPKKQIDYDDKNFILYIRGRAVRIKRKNEEPLDHYILKSLSESDFKEEVFYSEMIQDFFEGDEKKYRSLYSACERLNDKIFTEDNNIKDFLEYSSGRKGSCKVNRKYL